MVKTAGWFLAAIVIVVGGFQYRYNSLDPCEWLTQDLTQFASLPGISGLGGAAGTVMSTGQCLQNWMDLRVKEKEAEAEAHAQ
ncbi:hypothetical protein [Sneathiella limimaris]|uniref:hypothetical protein n=1 Tax=Sneathiella limimaris TaxID=1964213 RepID=UPI00146BD0D1|nr:hypothetical protein [Sneathiella limimaris]